MPENYDIRMTTGDIVELDTIIEKWIPSSDLVSATYDSGSDPSYNLDGFETKTAVFDPDKPGMYTININGQQLSVKVISANDALPNGGDYLDWSGFEPEPPHTYSVSGSFKTSLISTDYSSRQGLEFTQDSNDHSEKVTSRTVELSNSEKMNFVTEVNTDGRYDQFIIKIGDNRVFYVDSSHIGSHNWTKRQIDVSEYNGEFELSIGHDISGNRYRQVTSRITDVYFE